MNIDSIQDLWQTATKFQGLIIFFGPVIIPRVYRFITSRRKASKSLTLPVFISIVVLIFTAITQIIYARYLSSSRQNIILSLGARLQTSGDVIGSRLSRSEIKLDNSVKELLLSRFQSQTGRALYTIFGPAIGECQWCEFNTENNNTPLTSASIFSFIGYLLPEILWPYVLNGAIVLLTTSLWVPQTRQFRFYAVSILLALSAYDIYGYLSYPYSRNLLAVSNKSVDWFYWRRLEFRGYILLGYNISLAALFYLCGTGRIYDVSEPIDKRLLNARNDLVEGLGKFQTIISFRSLVSESDHYRNKYSAYWKKQSELRSQLDEFEDVQNARNNGMDRMNVASLRGEVLAYVNTYA